MPVAQPYTAYSPNDAAELEAIAAAANAAQGIAASQQQQAAHPSPLSALQQAQAVTAGASAGVTTSSGSTSVYGWLLAWFVVIVFLILGARTRIGYSLIYYGLALMLLFLMLTNYKWFAAAVKPLQTVSLS